MVGNITTSKYSFHVGGANQYVESVSEIKITRAFIKKMEKYNRKTPFPELLKEMFPNIVKNPDRESIAAEAFGITLPSSGSILQGTYMDEKGGFSPGNFTLTKLGNSYEADQTPIFFSIYKEIDCFLTFYFTLIRVNLVLGDRKGFQNKKIFAYLLLSYKGGNMKIKVRILSFIVLFSFIIVAFSGCPGWFKKVKVHEGTEGYMLSFAKNSNSKPVVRCSSDGVNWHSRSLNELLIYTGGGMGAAADDHGILRTLLFKNHGDEIINIWGLGCEFDGSSDLRSNNMSSSAPSGVSGRVGNSWFVAYNTPGQKISLRLYDPKIKKFIDQDLMSILQAGNSLVVSRPAMVRFKNYLIMCWRRYGEPLQFNSAQIFNDNELRWEAKYPFRLPTEIAGNRFLEGTSSAPALTHNHNTIYLAFTRKIAGGNHRLHLYQATSRYGFNWEFLSESTGRVFNNEDHYINIAGNSNGTILVAQISPGATSDDLPRYNVDEYNIHTNKWTKKDEKKIFGFTPEYEQFAFIATGKPK